MDFVCEPQANYETGITRSTVIQGDAELLLGRLPSNFFQCCVTSPPYWGLRDYRADGQIGDEDDPDGLKPKDLVGIPWRLAFALQKAGWYLRSDIIWEKPNCMPESVKDRPTRCHEYVFLFSKSLRYFYNNQSVREENGRNRRTVWSIPTEPFSGAHFATFPTKLIEPCILAGSKPGDWILDPFFGSGTVGVVCEQQQRNYVGIELNAEYVQLAVERIRKTERLLFTYDMAVIK
jgi:site-specific DNA-methyltransferase (adenine-specific)